MRIAWAGDPDWTAEVCDIDLAADGLVAAGTQLGADPEPYRATYALDASGDWITRRLEVRVAGGGALDLRHDGAGHWADRPDLEGALHCDLANSPLTNLMPIRRHALHERAGSAEIVVAWVSLPDLVVHREEQRYEHVRPGVVRFRSEGFEADIEVDADGLVVAYPQIARRVAILAP
jgi:uncharacterized protein